MSSPLDPHPADPALRALERSRLDPFTFRSARIRIRTTDHEQLNCHSPFFDPENGLLSVTTDEGEHLDLPTRIITGIWCRRPRISSYAIVAAVIVTLGAAVGRYLSQNAEFPNDGLFSGTIAGAFVAPLVVWLLQDLTFMMRWERIYDGPAA